MVRSCSAAASSASARTISMGASVPDFHLLLVIAEQLLVEIDRLLLHFGIFGEAHQNPSRD